MAEKLKAEQTGFKVWRNPDSRTPEVRYLGEVLPPARRTFLTAGDLMDLGFGPGEYTLLVPESAPYAKLVSKWQTLVVPG